MIILLPAKIEELLKKKHASNILPSSSSSFLPENQHSTHLSEPFGFPSSLSPGLENPLFGPMQNYANGIEACQTIYTPFPDIPSRDSQSNSLDLAFTEQPPSREIIRAL
jgi:hypothetical protein